MSTRVLLIDSYDSFTFNLVQALRARGAEVHVVRNDEITPGDALALLRENNGPLPRTARLLRYH